MQLASKQIRVNPQVWLESGLEFLEAWTLYLWIEWRRACELIDGIRMVLKAGFTAPSCIMFNCVIMDDVWQRVRCQWLLTWPRRPSFQCQLHWCTVHQTVPTVACQTEAVTVSSAHSVYCPTPVQLLLPLTLTPVVLLGVTGARVTSRCLATSTTTRLCGPPWRHPAAESRFLAQVRSD